MKLIARIKHAILWSKRKQLCNVRFTLIQDRQWLSANPVAVKLLERYIPLLDHDWEKASILSIDIFRDQLKQESIPNLKADADRLAEALTPSGYTKAAYSGEFSFTIHDADEDGDECMRTITVPWTTIKQIMAAIKARAALKAHERGEG